MELSGKYTHVRNDNYILSLIILQYVIIYYQISLYHVPPVLAIEAVRAKMNIAGSYSISHPTLPHTVLRDLGLQRRELMMKTGLWLDDPDTRYH